MSIRSLLISIISSSALLGGTPFAFAQSCPAKAVQTLARSRQLITVMTTSWNSKHAKLILWERPSINSPWQMSSTPIDAVVGSEGMAWGFAYASLATVQSGKMKQEGDNKSPAGVYPLGRRFGFTPEPLPNYLQLSSSTICIDDPKSSHYNQIVDTAFVKKDWKSAEEMHSVKAYRSGLEILYESDPKTQAGSCIFFHLWKSKDTGTAGCTAVAEDKMKVIQARLKPEAQPTMALLPRSEFSKWAPCFPGLPFAASAGAGAGEL